MKRAIPVTKCGTVLLLLGVVVFSASQTQAAKPQPLGCQIPQITADPDLSGDPACAADVCTATGGTVTFTGMASGAVPPYGIRWRLLGGSPFEASSTIMASGDTCCTSVVYTAAGNYTTTMEVTAGGPGAAASTELGTVTVQVIQQALPDKSITSTSQNAAMAQPTQVPEQPFASFPGFSVLAANDLGMHCADLDHQILSILPPFNVVHAQVLRKGTGVTPETLPDILDDTDVEVVYSAASHDLDPALQNPPPGGAIFKDNFWDINPATGNPYGFDAYDPLYPPGILALFPLPPDRGLPVPDLAELYLGGGTLVAGQQDMPGISNPYVANVPQFFDRFDTDFPFFINFPFGYTVTQANYFAADGVPIAPVDDLGRINAFPLMRIQARDKTGNLTGTAGTVLATEDVVLPVADETDCQICHADQSVCDAIGQICDGKAASLASVPFTVVTSIVGVPGATTRMQVLNAAKINVLRLHDAKHGTNLDNSRPVVCATCHYSPALDLAHFGPNNDNGKQQTIHVSLSRAMHYFHGLQIFQGQPVFPDMPPPGTNPATRFDILEKTCYACHPGKITECLRGAMFNGGMLCQDCHGGMLQVGNDFTENFPTTPFPGGADLTKRVPWASEPHCESCHTGDAVTNLAKDPNVIASADGIRLLQAYRTNDPDAIPIESPTSRFAANNPLYRLSGNVNAADKGHNGIACENCHGSTHAVWPVSPRSGTYVANDNVAAVQLQGHDGKIQECDVCHERDANGDLTMPLGLEGPHSMHPVQDARWNRNHRQFTGGHYDNCRPCHGLALTGTTLSETAAERVLFNKAGEQVIFPEGHRVGCGDCHKQKR